MDLGTGTNTDRFGRERRVEVIHESRRRPQQFDGYATSGAGGYSGNANHYQNRNYDQGYRSNNGANAGYDRSFAHKSIEGIMKTKKGFYEQPQPLQFAEFLQMLGHDQDPKIAAEKYEEYKRHFEQKRCMVFYALHKKEAWFREKYDPELANSIQAEAAKVYEKNFELFIEDWNNGVFLDFTLDKASSSHRRNDNQEDTTMQENGALPGGESKQEEVVAMETDVIEKTSSENVNVPEEGVEHEESLNNVVDTCLRTATEKSTSEDLRRPSNAIVVLNLNTSITREQLKAHVANIPEIINVYMGDPNVFKKYNRIAWLILRDDANGEEITKTLNENYSSFTILDKNAADDAALKVETESENVSDLFTLRFTLSSRLDKVRYTPEIASTEVRIRKDLANVMMITEKLSKEFTFIKSLPLTDFPHNTIEEAKQVLDWYIILLRKVFFFCYYSLSSPVGFFDYKCSSAEALIHKNGVHYWRRVPDHELSEEEIRKFNAWENKLDDAVMKFLTDEADQDDLRRLDYKTPESMISEWFNKNIEKVEDSKFRCKMPGCTKMFKGEEYVEKHIRNKHSDYYNEFVKDVEMKARYLKDPSRPSFTVAYQTPQNSYNSGYSQFRGHAAGGRQFQQRRHQNNSRYTPYGSSGPTRNRQQGMRGPGGRKLTSYVDLDAPAPEQKIELDYD